MNKYDIEQNFLGEEKKRYTPVEKAKRVLATAQRVEEIKSTLKQDLLEAVADIFALAMESNSKDIVKYSEKLSEKITKIIG